MLQKQLKFNIKSVDEQGKFSGLAAAYGNIDSDSEIIDLGCFKRSISHTNGKGIPVCWTHDLRTPIAWGTFAEERKEGLYVEAQFLINTEQGRTAYEWAKMGAELGANVGISVGFRPTKEGSYFKDGIKHFKDAQLVEYSLCVAQANPRARVATVKEQKDFAESLAEARSLSQLYEERCTLESALYDATQESLGNDQLATDEKKAEVAKSYEQYAAAMSDWYGRFIDADTDNDPEEDNMDGKNEKAGRAISAATAEQIKQAMGHLADAGAMHQKAIGILTSLSKQAYTANDVNQPNPVGGGKAEKASSDSDTHSLAALLEMVRSVADRSKTA